MKFYVHEMSVNEHINRNSCDRYSAKLLAGHWLPSIDCLVHLFTCLEYCTMYIVSAIKWKAGNSEMISDSHCVMTANNVVRCLLQVGRE